MAVTEIMRLTSLIVGMLSFACFGPGSKGEVCNTPGCVSIANTILSFMDPTLDPCQDFYRFTCGNFLKSNSNLFSAFALFYLVKDQLVKLLVNQAITDLPAAFTKAQDYYQSCMDEDTIEKIGLIRVKESLKRYGGWPIITSKWNENDFNWIKTTKQLVKEGHKSNMIVALTVEVLSTDNTKNTIVLTKADLGLDIDFLLAGISDDVSQAYYKYMVEMAVAFGACRSKAELEMKEVFEFEAKIANISQSDDPLNPYAENPKIMTITELKVAYPYIAWSSFIDAVIGGSVKVTDNEKIYVRRPTYFDHLGPILQKTRNRVIANYIMWRTLLASANYLPKRIRQLQYNYDDVYRGYHNNDRSTFCLLALNSENWKVIMGAAYVARYVKPGTKEKATEIVRLYQDQLINVLSTVEWMDDATRSMAVEKVRNIFLAIGYPNELTDINLVNNYYKDLKIDKMNFYANTFRNRKWKRDKEDSMLRLPYNISGWEHWSFITEVNAGYDSTNILTILAVILQDVIFSEDRPLYLNSGTLGFIGGHELTHSVDSDGAQYDSSGNLRNWWSDDSKKTFNEKLKALSAEYSSYYVKEADLYLFGDQVVLEAIADQGGFKVAHMAVDKWLSENPDQESSRIAGLEKYTPRQIFWLSSAMIQCRTYNRDNLIRMIRTDDHAPEEFRINVAFRNSPFFSADWNCPVGSYMNKKEKVNVW